MPIEKVLALLKEHNIKLSNENVYFAFNDGLIEVSYENKTISIDVKFTDKVIHIEGSLDQFLEN